MFLTITHTSAAGTLIEGTAKGDGTAPVLKSNGWRWGSSIGVWYVPASRDRRPKTHTIETTQAQLAEAGYDVHLDLDDTIGTTAESEANKIIRQQDRADALATKASRKHAADTAAMDNARATLDRLPAGGEPVKVGHHSEGRHRRAIDTADRAMKKSVEASTEANIAQERADTAAATTGHRYSAPAVASRIKRVETDLRTTKRKIEGSSHNFGGGIIETTPAATGAYLERLEITLAEQCDQLSYWQGIRGEQIRAGEATNYTREQISKGDSVKIRGTWYEVARANQKTVSLATGYSWTSKADYAQIKDHSRADDA